MLDSTVDFDSALHMAAYEGHLGIVKFLVQVAVRSGREKLISRRDRWGTTPLGLAMVAKNK